MRRLLQPLLVGLLVAASVGCDDNSSAAPADALVPDSRTLDGGPSKELGTVGEAGTDVTGPWANIYKVSPTDDNRKTSMVKLQHITDSTGALTGTYAKVYNCTQDENGQKVSITYGGMSISGTICTQKQTALPGKNGTYLHIAPPAKDTDGKDAFSEVMMYHHVTTIHDHLSKSFGLSHLDNKALRAIVNAQVKINLFPVWISLGNAAYMPKSSGEALKKQFGVDLLGGEDGILFGYNNVMPTMPSVNFAYDASVIYHEYTHYSVGSALWQPAADKYGMDPTPKAMNEAMADYMPSSFLNNPKLGAYALGSSARDLTRVFKCPDHIVGEEHIDGEVASGALWAARKVAGASILDRAVWNAALSFTASTTFDQAGTAILDELKKLSPDKVTAVKTIFDGQGLTGCVRVMSHKDLKAATYGPGWEGTATAPSSFATAGVPSYLQYKIAVQQGTKELTLTYKPEMSDPTGLGLGTGGTQDVHVALKRGSSAIGWTYTGGTAAHDAKVVLQGTKDTAGLYTLVISGDCLESGDLIYQFINKGTYPGRATTVSVTQSATKTNTTDNFTGCPK